MSTVQRAWPRLVGQAVVTAGRSLTAGPPGSWAIEVYTNDALRATYGFTVQ